MQRPRNRLDGEYHGEIMNMMATTTKIYSVLVDGGETHLVNGAPDGTRRTDVILRVVRRATVAFARNRCVFHDDQFRASKGMYVNCTHRIVQDRPRPCRPMFQDYVYTLSTNCTDS